MVLFEKVTRLQTVYFVVQYTGFTNALHTVTSQTV